MDACIKTDGGTPTGADIPGSQWFNYSDKVGANPHTVGNDNLNMNDIMDGMLDKTPGDTDTHANGTYDQGTGANQVGGHLLSNVNDVYNTGVNPTVSAKLQLNGHDRFSLREGRYFNLVQPYQHHERVPSVGINVYSFGLKPEEHQPSGTCNMSRIDNATLHLTLTSNVKTDAPAKVRVYATNYNVLRIMSGMGGLAYSN